MNGVRSRRVFLFAAAGVLVMPALLPLLGSVSGGGRFDAAAARAAVGTVPPGREEAALAGCCFWSMEAVFKQLKGVDRVTPGYAGGRTPNPGYEEVETGLTGHAETVDIVFNPRVISYHQLLRVFLTVRDPTTLNRQGPDEGTQYRSLIFYRSPQQKQVARQSMREITAARIWSNPIVTELRPYSRFYPAESYHRDYYRLHPDEPYCKFVIAPEIAQFRAKFAPWLKR